MLFNVYPAYSLDSITVFYLLAKMGRDEHEVV